MNPLSDALVAPLAARNNPVLILEDGGEVTGQALFDLSGRIANVLTNEGLSPGDRVAMQAGKSLQALALYLACLRAGALFLPLNTAYTTAELDYFIGDAEPAVVVCDPKDEGALADVVKAHGAVLHTLDANPSFTDAERGPDDLAAVLYTSGTTGRSKGAMLSHDNLLSNANALAKAWRFTANDTLLHALPIFHAHGLFVAVNVLLRVAGRMIFLPRFDADAVVANLPKATAMMGVPTFYTRLLSDVRFTKELTQHMRLFISGSAPLLAETHQAFEARTGHRILERYGMTETTMSTSNPYDGDRRAGTVGFPLPGVEARVVDAETARPVPQSSLSLATSRGLIAMDMSPS